MASVPPHIQIYIYYLSTIPRVPRLIGLVFRLRARSTLRSRADDTLAARLAAMIVLRYMYTSVQLHT
jgi:hypothetical protein